MGEPKDVGTGFAGNNVSLRGEIDLYTSNSDDFSFFKGSEFELGNHDEPHLVGFVLDSQLKIVLVLLKNLEDFDKQVDLSVFLLVLELRKVFGHTFENPAVTHEILVLPLPQLVNNNPFLVVIERVAFS